MTAIAFGERKGDGTMTNAALLAMKNLKHG